MLGFLRMRSASPPPLAGERSCGRNLRGSLGPARRPHLPLVVPPVRLRLQPLGIDGIAFLDQSLGQVRPPEMIGHKTAPGQYAKACPHSFLVHGAGANLEEASDFVLGAALLIAHAAHFAFLHCLLDRALSAMRLRRLAFSRPSLVRSEIRSRSNCAMEVRTWEISRLAAVVVSISSARGRKPGPRVWFASTVSSRWH